MKKCLLTLIVFSTLMCITAFADDVSSSTTITNTSGSATNNETTPSQTVTHSTTTTTYSHQDDDIVSAIYAKYAHDPAMLGTALTVSSQNGLVTIRGTVTAQSQADEAVIVAKAINGVKDVNSQVHVTTNPQTNNPQKESNY